MARELPLDTFPCWLSLLAFLPRYAPSRPLEVMRGPLEVMRGNSEAVAEQILGSKFCQPVLVLVLAVSPFFSDPRAKARAEATTSTILRGKNKAYTITTTATTTTTRKTLSGGLCLLPAKLSRQVVDTKPNKVRLFFFCGGLNPGERHSRVTRDHGTVMLCAPCTTTVLSHNCCTDLGRPLTKKVMSHSRDGQGVTAPLRTNIVPFTAVWNLPPSVTPLLKSHR